MYSASAYLQPLDVPLGLSHQAAIQNVPVNRKPLVGERGLVRVGGGRLGRGGHGRRGGAERVADDLQPAMHCSKLTLELVGCCLAGK